eukprot:11176181-Lingulodinium_polyedra.AAC.1
MNKTPFALPTDIAMSCGDVLAPARELLLGRAAFARNAVIELIERVLGNYFPALPARAGATIVLSGAL